MKLQQQKDKLKLASPVVEKLESRCRKHGPLLGNSIRAGIFGPSGCGKTHVMIGLLFHPEGLKYKNVYVHSSSIFQPKYQELKIILQDIPEMSYYGLARDITPVDKVKPYSIIIFDDCTSHSQSEIQKYYAMGRHKKLDTFTLAQSYAFVNKQLIRDNMNLIILFPMDTLNLKHVYSDHVQSDLSFPELIKMCQKSWEKPFGFLVIDKSCTVNKGRYRCGFDEFFIKE